MKWVTVRTDEGEQCGLVLDDDIHMLGQGEQLIGLLGDDGEKLHRAGERATSNPTHVLKFAGSDLAPPLRPVQIRDTLLFLQHLKNARGDEIEEEWNQIPAFYFSNTQSITGPYDPIAISPGSQMFDFELEIAAVVGREGGNIPPDQAEDYLAGFMIFNDWSARDLQRKEMVLGIGQGKGKDGANTFGPMFVTKDELESRRSGNSYDLKVQASVNGELVGEGTMDQMDWHFGDVVAFASRGTRIVPGEAICSGTVPTCCLIEHFAVSNRNSTSFRGWLQPGDVVTLDVEVLGTQQQEITPSLPVYPLSTGH